MEDRNRYAKFLVCFVSAIFIMIAMETTCYSSSGVLLMVKGKVTIQSDGATYPGKSGLRLRPGDIVNSMGGTASILMSDGKMHQLKKSSSFTVPKKKDDSTEDRMVARLMDTIKETTDRGRGPTVKGMVRGEREIILTYPYNSFITPEELRFEWEAMEEMKDVEVSLKSMSPALKYSFKVEPGKNRITLPEDAPQLVPGVRYYWKVKGFEKVGNAPYTSKLCWFGIIGAEEIGRLESDLKKLDGMSGLDENNREFLKANLYISQGLYHQATRILEQSLIKFPEDQGLKELLKGLFLKMKNIEAAEKVL